MNFTGIDLHTNKFTCCYRDEKSSAEDPKKCRVETFTLDVKGLGEFYKTLNAETHVLVETTITTFPFVRLFKDKAGKVIIANTFELKQVSLARCNTDKIDADKLCRILKAQVLSGEQLVSPVTLPPVEIQELRGLFTAYRLFKKQNTQIKNRIHSLLKEQLHGFTQEEIFGKKDRQEHRSISPCTPLHFQVNLLLDRLERDEADVELLKCKALLLTAPFMTQPPGCRIPIRPQQTAGQTRWGENLPQPCWHNLLTMCWMAVPNSDTDMKSYVQVLYEVFEYILKYYFK